MLTSIYCYEINGLSLRANLRSSECWAACVTGR